MNKTGFFKLSLNNNWLKGILISLGIITILIILGNYIIKKKIVTTISEIEEFTYDEVSFNLLFGNLSLTNIVTTQTLLDTNQVDVKSSRIKLKGLSYWQYLRHNKIVVRKLNVDDLEVHISDKKVEKTSISKAPKNTLKAYSEFLVGQFIVKNGKINIHNKQFEKTQIGTFSTEISALQYLPNADNLNVKWKSIAVHLDDLFLNEKQQNHAVSMANIQLNPDKSLDILDIKIIPKRSKEKFLEPLTYRKDRLDIQIPKLHINNFSAKEILIHKRLITDYIYIEKPTIEVFSNYTKPRCPNCFKTYFYEYLGKTDFEISVDSIVLENGKIDYELLKTINRMAGKLFWTDVNSKIYDVTNMQSKNRENTSVEITAKFMQQGDTKVNFTFPNYDSKKNYTFSASLENFVLNSFNPFLDACYRLNIEKGEFIRLRLNGSGNLNTASGEMELLYDNLAVKFYKSDNSERSLMTNLANSLLKEQNGVQGKTRTAKMYAERNRKKIFLENWIETLKSGLYGTLLPEIMLPKELTSGD